MSLIPNKNRLDVDPKIEFIVTGSKTPHKEFLTQLINEQVGVSYQEDQVGKVKLVVAAHVVSNNGNAESAIAFGIPHLINKFTEVNDQQMTDLP